MIYTNVRPEEPCNFSVLVNCCLIDGWLIADTHDGLVYAYMHKNQVDSIKGYMDTSIYELRDADGDIVPNREAEGYVMVKFQGDIEIVPKLLTDLREPDGQSSTEA